MTRLLDHRHSYYGQESMRLKMCFMALVAAVFSVNVASARQPNIILIMADDLGYETVARNGGESYKTPELDRLAATGMRFEHCYVQPVCTPTRVELMTGASNARNYIRFGVLDRNATTFAHILKTAGYATAIAGKWQLGREKDSPRHFGFDEAFLWQHTRRPPRFANPGLERNGEEVNFTNGEYGPELINDFALDFITRHKDQPFLLYYPMLLTHGPYQPTPDSADWDPTYDGDEKKINDKKYFADMVAYMDKLVGRVVAKVDELGLREDTLIIFLGDNGTGRGVVSQFKGEDYPGGKGLATARGMRVPLIVNWPEQVAAGKVNGELVGAVDFLPTICEAAGVARPSAPSIDGQSFLPQSLGQADATPRTWLYTWYSSNGTMARKTEFARTKTHKLYQDGRFFDLGQDPYEEGQPRQAAELAGADAGVAKELRGVLNQYADARPEELRKLQPTERDVRKQANRQRNRGNRGRRAGRRARQVEAPSTTP
jgi:arylsulfatase A